MCRCVTYYSCYTRLKPLLYRSQPLGFRKVDRFVRIADVEAILGPAALLRLVNDDDYHIASDC
jgi:hypothetical protein